MSLPRKSVHVKLDHDVHADLIDLCEYDKMLPAHWIEQLVETALAKEFTRAECLRRRKASRIPSAKRSEVRLSQLDDLPTRDTDKA